MIRYEEIIDFLVSKWAPIVDALHMNRGGIIVQFLTEILEVLGDLQTHEVSLQLV